MVIPELVILEEDEVLRVVLVGRVCVLNQR